MDDLGIDDLGIDDLQPAAEADPVQPPPQMTPIHSEGIRPERRSLLIDVVRGIAISLVVLGHTDQGVTHRQWWHSSSVGLYIRTFIYAFHMPAFFFVSGVFLHASIAKRGTRRFALDKARAILWPYLLFSAISALILALAARYTVTGPGAPRTLLAGLLTGNLSWFLPTIFFVLMLGMSMRNVPGPLFFLLAVVLSTWYPQTPLAYVTRGLKFLPFLALGMWVGKAYATLEETPRWLAALFAVSIGGLLLACTRPPAPPETSWLFIPLGVAGTLMLLLFARLLGRSRPARVLAWVGEASFGIFLLAAYPQGATREALLRLDHITNPYVQTVVPTIFAVLLPALVYRYRRSLHIDWMFFFPR